MKNIENGIPIKDYRGDDSDKCLKLLNDYLRKRILD
jgi:hypothetical protein